ncbi:hypothetical protein PPACK8108_LOCUS25608 [Phakopsora pachyrhizi]|uniref:HECT domain-containing protein n=1 Tax=Phakopsora pachyrhizi TaxID=170000 RepID=A0AAV0BV28_PHAPC|nr:hypothetical protein PPACK8108_LOCUS25608 [Phakopsora pachyrhizi]
MLSRQLKIRLVAAEGTDVPKNWANVVVSIHAIVTFQAFNDYLQPRIIKAQDDERLGCPSGSGRLSGMLAAFAAVAGLPAASSSSQTSQIEEGGTRSSSDLWSDICRYPNKFPCTSTEFKIKWAPSSSVALSSSAPEELMEIDITRRDQMELDNQRVGVGPIDQELEPRSPNHNSPVSVQPAQDGSKMEAHTPHGTWISTPLNSRPPSALGSKPSSMAAVGSTSCSSRPFIQSWWPVHTPRHNDASSPDPGSREEGPAASLEHLSKYVVKKQAIEADGGLTESERDGAIRQIRVDGAKVEDLAVEFVLPGYDIEMKPNGTETVVTIDNMKEFIDLVISWTLSKGVICQVEMFKSSMITRNQLMKQNNISMVS